LFAFVFARIGIRSPRKRRLHELASAAIEEEGQGEEHRWKRLLPSLSISSPVEIPERLSDPPVLEREPLGRGPRGEHPLAVEDHRSAAAEQGLWRVWREGKEEESKRARELGVSCPPPPPRARP